MAETLRREACSECGSSNNLTTWKYHDKVFQKCMSPGCKKTTCLSDSKELTIQKTNFSDNPQFLTGEFKDTRGLTAETCRVFGIMLQEDRHIFQYKDAQKIRIPKKNGKKDMFWIGNSQEAGLFGEHLSYDKAQSIIITEGEFDAASVYQSGHQSYGINGGAGEKKTAEEIRRALPLLREFSRIIFYFDNDTAGKKALEEVLELEDLPIEKVQVIIDEDFKDANDALLSGQLENILQNKCKDYTPKGLQYGSDLNFNVLEEPEQAGLQFPFEFMENCFHGLRNGEILLIGAGSGAGKSLFSKHLAFHWMKNFSDIKIANIFLEEKQKFTLQSFVSLEVGKPTAELIEMPYKGLSEIGQKLLGSNKYIFDNHFGSLQSKQLFKKIRFLAKKVDVIILDHISIVVSGMESREGERKDIDRMMTYLKSIAIETGVRFILISHLRRLNGDQTYEQGAQITANSFRGSHALYQLSDSVIALERDQQNDIKQNQIVIRALKNRFRGKVGILDTLHYNTDTGKLTTLDELFRGQ